MKISKLKIFSMRHFLIGIILLVLTVSQTWSANFKKGPYLIYENNNTEMTVLWQTDEDPSATTIEWGITPSYGNGPYSVLQYGDHQFKYVITGLNPEVLYFYRINVDDQQQTGSFRAAPHNDTSKVTIYGFGDSRTYPNKQNQVISQLLENISNVPEKRRTLSIHSGDLVGNGNYESNWQNHHFNRNYSKILQFHRELPLMAARGNHEGSGLLLRKYYPYDYVDPNMYYYSFDYGPIHITVVDDQSIRTPDSPQYNWIEDDLASTAKLWKIVVFHEPAWSAGSHGNNAINQMLTENLFEPYGVDITFTGHNHYYARNEKDNVVHITSGGGGAPLYAPYSSYPYYITSSRTYHFCRISIKENTLQFSAFDQDGNVIDNFFLHNGPDLSPPVIDGIRATADASTVIIEFDECVESGVGWNGAENTGNYDIIGFTITAAELDDTLRVVRLTVSPELVDGILNEITVQSINDCASSPNTMPNPETYKFIYPLMNHLPIAHAGQDQIIECTGNLSAPVILDGSTSYDLNSSPETNDDIILFEWFEDFGLPSETYLGTGEILEVALPLGEHNITLQVTDQTDLMDTDEVITTIVDTIAPEISVSVYPDTLWPPNHRMVDIEASVSVRDICSIPAITLTSLTSNEADDAMGGGDGHTINDIQDVDLGSADFHFKLRAERSGDGNGRTYEIIYAATDDSGNKTFVTSYVNAPHNKKKSTK